MFLPEGTHETRLIDQIDRYINKVVDLGTQAGYLCNGVASKVGCTTGQTRTCTNSCHGKETW